MLTARPKLKDVAARAGTSTATASRVISNRGFVAPETRARVLEAMQQLNYRPNLRARGLRQQSSRVVGLIIPNLQNAYYTALADTLLQLLGQQRYQLLVASTQDNPDNEREMLEDLFGQDIEGLIWVPTAPSDVLMRYLCSQSAPVVSIVRRVPGDQVDTAVFEDVRGAQAATQHLISLGHRAIGYIGGDTRHSSNHARQQGYLAALQLAGIAADDSLVKTGPSGNTWVSVATLDLLRRTAPPTALLVASNAFMPDVLRTIQHVGVDIPAEMSLICFDDIDWFSIIAPRITAVSVSHRRLAETALELLLTRLGEPQDSPAPPRYVEISCDLIARDSTALARQATAPWHENLLAK